MNEQETTRSAEMEVSQAHARRYAAELERNAAAGLEANAAVHRAAAEEQASEAKLQASQIESQTRSMETSARLSRQDAANERAGASSSTSIIVMMIAVLLLGIVLAVGFYIVLSQPKRRADSTQNAIGHRAAGAASSSFSRMVRTIPRTDNMSVKLT